MSKQLDKALSLEVAQTIKSKSKKPFDNAYKAALATAGASYVQGFLVAVGKPFRPLEHAWIEVNDTIIDPNLPHIKKNADDLVYFAAQSISVKKLKSIIEESQEDYPEDDPLPIYGNAPYEYYGDVMLGDKAYLEAHQAAEAKCKELNQGIVESN
ncbi:hypothetical protein [Calothrix sp. UHCC 0171]|uniref:hypothetical protein n=1 Tax=Calothrix sp. UHCC 0171 TaxID=3110245 RepID=UPI002B1F9F27|nr:hypothetical protein [Calothrix sp. UHCC 0171]MEA5570770.1 hypothetical protein [Calothrix sp. UHCC 0171]